MITKATTLLIDLIYRSQQTILLAVPHPLVIDFLFRGQCIHIYDTLISFFTMWWAFYYLNINSRFTSHCELLLFCQTNERVRVGNIIPARARVCCVAPLNELSVTQKQLGGLPRVFHFFLFVCLIIIYNIKSKIKLRSLWPFVCVCVCCICSSHETKEHPRNPIGEQRLRCCCW